MRMWQTILVNRNAPRATQQAERTQTITIPAGAQAQTYFQRVLLFLSIALSMLFAGQVRALDLDTPFTSIDGGDLRISDWAGQPVLVVNTASMCAFTDQYRSLQTLYDTYRDDGLIVLAVPSDDFNQELDDNAAVKDFCEMVYGIDMPMTVITDVRGRDAHPFYQSLRDAAGYVPEWNFSKVLLDGDGTLAATFPAGMDPLSDAVTGKIAAMVAAQEN